MNDKIALVVWSKTGNTKTMANSLKDGALSEGLEVEFFKAYNFTPEIASTFEKIALGCPAMGAEVLEETEFEPMYQSIKHLLKGKKVFFFGSYSWGNGEWMEKWKNDALSNGISMFREPIITVEPLSFDILDKCKQVGIDLASA